MNFYINGDRWFQEYTEVGKIETKNPPVDCCYLLSGETINGNIMPDSYDFAIKTVSEYCVKWMIKSDFSYKSLFACQNANHYLTIGVSKAAIPYKEILTYLTSKMFESFASIKKNDPSKASVDEFVK